MPRKVDLEAQIEVLEHRLAKRTLEYDREVSEAKYFAGVAEGKFQGLLELLQDRFDPSVLDTVVEATKEMASLRASNEAMSARMTAAEAACTRWAERSEAYAMVLRSICSSECTSLLDAKVLAREVLALKERAPGGGS